MTYNIQHGSGMDRKIDLERTAGVIRQAKADLVAVQEVDVKTRRVGGVDEATKLGELTGLHVVFGKAMDFSGGQYGVAILSRWPIVESRTVALPFIDKETEPRALLIARIKPEGRPEMIFACTHVEFANAAIQLRQTEVILKELAKEPAPRQFLAGDFNAEPASPAIELLKKSFTSDTDDRVATHPADNPKIKIDWIFHRAAERVKAGESRVIEENAASDHRPVVVEYQIAG